MSEQLLLSRREIAARIKRSPTAVNKAIKRLEIKPVFSTGKFEYYDEPTIEKLNDSMRRKNYTQRIHEQ